MSAAPERDVLGNGEVVVERGFVTEQTDRSTDGSPTVSGGQIAVEHRPLAPPQRYEASAHPEQGALARPVRPAQTDDLLTTEGHGGPGQGGEPSDQGDCVGESHHGTVGIHPLKPR